ncbi:MAG: phosphatase PAP2 family protein [Candidatus Kapaibacterium sp.]
MRARVQQGEKRTETTFEAIRNSLWSTDWMSLGMLSLYTLLDIIFITEVRSSFGLLQVNILVGVTIIACCVWYDQTGSRIALLFRSFYILPVGYMMYSQIHNYIPLVNPGNFDATLAAWDHAIFGVNPTEWIYRFAHPILTEYFQIWYNFFQLLLVVPAVSLYRQNRMPAFRLYAMTLLFAFYLSYLCYFAMPAIGPRFEVHDFHSIDRELPGLVLTEPFRDLINAGNNIQPEMDDPYEFVNRDCMPSGHTLLSILGILMAWRLRTRWRWLMTIGGVSIVISTVYLRYHYVVDLMAGLTLAIIIFLLHEKLAEWWTRRGIPV